MPRPRWTKGARAAHKFLALNDETEATRQEGDTNLEHGSRKAFWSELWSSAALEDGLDEARRNPAWMMELRTHALQEEPMEDITVERLRSLARGTKATAALGLDGWRPHDWRDLPTAALHDLAEQYNTTMRKLVYPYQTLDNAILFLPKVPTGERPIALTAGCYRLLMAHGKQDLTDWEQHGIGFWETAVRGSSALRAALVRMVKSDIYMERGMAVVEILWDMEKFYDTGVELGFPLRLLCLGIMIHRTPRVLRARGEFGGAVAPHRSILAGCMQSVCWSRLVLWAVIDQAHRDFGPVRVQTWVDDMAQRTHHPSAVTAVKASTDCAIFLVQELRS